MIKKSKSMSRFDFILSDKAWIILIVGIFILSMAIRLYDLTDAPLDFHPTRQLHSAMIARGMFYQHLDDIPDWKKERALNQWRAEGLIEPQIIETLTALVYRLIGNEQLWIARLWSILFWMLAGIFVWLILKKFVNIQASAVGLAYFLLWPYAAIASRAFQPEALMILATSAGIWAATEWLEKRNFLWAALAGLLCGLAIYIKSVAVFFIAPALAGLILANSTILTAIKNRQVWMIFLLSVLPYTLYHFYGVYVLGLLGQQFSLRFFPSMWFDPVFYIRWTAEINKVVGLEILLASLFGILVFSKKKYTGLLIGLVAGYFLYGLTFAYHVTTHDYYHLPLFITISFGLGLLVDGLLNSVQKEKKRIAYLALTGLLIIFSLQKAWVVRSELKRTDYAEEVRSWQDLGNLLGYDKKVTGLMPDYGYRLAYWGWVSVSPWMQTADMELRELAGGTIDYQKSLKTTVNDHDFFVITNMEEFSKQKSLEDYLQNNFPIFSETDKWIIYQLR